VQHLEIEFAAAAPEEEFRALPGVRETRADGRLLTVAYEGSADTIVKIAARHEVQAIRAHEDDLEDIFLRYYRTDGAS
jgi:hypothetical protein